MKVSVAQVVEADNPETIVRSFIEKVEQNCNFAPAVGEFFEAYVDILVDDRKEKLSNKALTAINLFVSNEKLASCIRLSPKLIEKVLAADANLAVSTFSVELNYLFKSLMNLCKSTNQSVLHLLTSSYKVDLLLQTLEMADSSSEFKKALWVADGRGCTALDVAKSLLEIKPYHAAAMAAALRSFSKNIS